MRKHKLLLVIFAVVLALQIMTPIGMILWHTGLNKKILKEGKEYRFRAHIFEAYDGTVYYDLTDTHEPLHSYRESGTPRYVLKPLDDGFTEIEVVYKKPPKGQDYFLENANMESLVGSYESDATAESPWSFSDYSDTREDYVKILQEEECTLTMRVYRHRCTVTGLYDSKGRPIDEFLREVGRAPVPQETETQT